MHISELTGVAENTHVEPVPLWMRGAFRRRSITFANGLTDADTRVFWLQSQGLTIDLRLPLISEQKAYHSDDEHAGQYEAWYGYSHWDGALLDWSGGVSYQLHNRWPEPAILRRTGNCMMEFAPSGIYVEDWRLLSDESGPLIGLELLSEKHIASGRVTQRSGALIICGRIAGLVLDRPPLTSKGGPLAERLLSQSEAEKDALRGFETAIGTGSLDDGFTVIHALHYGRTGQNLCPLDGFEYDAEPGFVRQVLMHNGELTERRYRVDTFQPEFPFSAATQAEEQARRWYRSERLTLARYLKKVT